MSAGQSGQALVGALVVTTLAFLMAGAVAVGASALLSQESNGFNASSRDLTVQDALAAAAAGVAGKGSSGGSAPCSPPTLLSTTVLPNGYSSQARCLRVDGVPAGPITLLPLPWSGNCAMVDLSTYSSSHVLIWFSANVPGSGNVTATIDNNRSSCGGGSALCNQRASGSVSQLLLDCDIALEGQEECDGNCGNGGPVYLHVQNAGHSPVRARLATYSATGGSIYVLAATTGMPGGPANEEADVWVSRDGATTALRFEGTL
jgi:hypothetical protein